MRPRFSSATRGKTAPGWNGCRCISSRWRSFGIERWDDTRLQTGRWRDQIERAIDSAKVAILLVSADFLASDFIENEELPPLLDKAQRKGTVILPVILTSCLFTETKSLSQLP